MIELDVPKLLHAAQYGKYVDEGGDREFVELWKDDSDEAVRTTILPWVRGFETQIKPPSHAPNYPIDIEKIITWGEINYVCQYNSSLNQIRINEPDTWDHAWHDYSIDSKTWTTTCLYSGSYFSLRTVIDWTDKKIYRYFSTQPYSMAYIRLNPSVMPTFLPRVLKEF